MGDRRGRGGFVAGALVGAAGAAAYFLLRGKQTQPAPSAGFVQRRAADPAPAFGDAAADALTSMRSELQSAQTTLRVRNEELAGLRAAGTPPPQDDWQTRVPALAALGKQLAAMPPAKLLAVDQAVAAQQLPRITAAPQDLASVNGIGGAYEQRLYAAGIGSFWELANLSDEDFVQLLALTELQRAAFAGAAIRAQAQQLAVATGTVGQLWEGVTPDDLEPIKGIGKVFEQRLYDAGLRTYAQLAAATPAELANICGANLPVAPDYASWIEQAQALAQKSVG